MIDYFFRFPDEATAISQAPAGFYTPAQPGPDPSLGAWNADKVLPNIKAWRPSQDIGGQHTYLTGWFAIVSLQNLNQQMLNHAALQFALDRTACIDGRPFVVKNNIGGVIGDVACAPIFCGSPYPVGGYS